MYAHSAAPGGQEEPLFLVPLKSNEDMPSLGTIHLSAGGLLFDGAEAAGPVLCTREDCRVIPLLKTLSKQKIRVELHGRRIREGLAVSGVEPKKDELTKTQCDAAVQLLRSRRRTVPESGLLSFDDSQLHLFLYICQTCYPIEQRKFIARDLDTLENSTNDSERIAARTALTLLANISWGAPLSELPSLEECRRMLDAAACGMESVKEWLTGTLALAHRTGSIPSHGRLLLSGPPGCGKTTIALAVARAMGLPMIKLELNALSSSDSLVGSSRVYSNARPGILAQELAQSGSLAAVVLLDEIDKAASGISGDRNVSATLLSLTDTRSFFRDEFLQVDLPTDRLLIIATANEPDRISAPLLDRFLRIDVPGYSLSERIEILQSHVLPRMLEKTGMEAKDLTVSPLAARWLCRDYARGPGIRGLERRAAQIAAFRAQELEQGAGDALVDTERLQRILGPAPRPDTFFPAAGQARAAVRGPEGIRLCTVQAEVRPVRFPQNHFLGFPAERCQDKGAAAAVAAERCLKRAGILVPEARLDVTLSLLKAERLPADGEIGIAVFAAVVSAATATPLSGEMAFAGSCDLLGRLSSGPMDVPSLEELHKQGITILWAGGAQPAGLSVQGLVVCSVQQADLLCQLARLDGGVRRSER